MEQVRVGDISIEIVRKEAVKHMTLAVYPPEGRVSISAPNRIDQDTLRLFAVSRLSWIKKQRERYLVQERQTFREYVSGETHFFRGRSYLLKVRYLEKVNARASVEIRNKRYIVLSVPVGSSMERRRLVVQRFYRNYLKQQVPLLIQKWVPLLGIEYPQWAVRLMRTKWGSCNPQARRILINLEMAKKPFHCLEYIVLHELVHLLESRHNQRYREIISRFMPQWEKVKEELNRFMLGHVQWQ